MEAVEETKPKFNWSGVMAVSAGHFWIDYYAALLPSIVPYLVLNMNLTPSRVGFAIMMTNVATSVFQPLFGHYADTKGNILLIPIAILWSAAAISSVGFTDNFIIIILLSALSGFGITLFHPLGVIEANRHAAANEGLGLSMYSLMGNLGFALTPMIIVPLLNTFNRTGFFISFLPGLIMSAILLIYYRNKRPSIRINTVHEKVSPSSRKKVLILTLIEIFRACGYNTLSTYIALYFVSTGMSQISAGYIQTAFGVMSVAGLFLGGFFAGRFNAKRLMLSTMGLAIIFFLGFSFTSGIVSILFILVTAFLYRFCFNVSILAGQALLPNGKGMVTGLIMGIAPAVGSVVTFISGIVADTAGVETAVKYTVIFAMLSFVMTLFFKPEEEAQPN